jgi:hypothetical protein
MNDFTKEELEYIKELFSHWNEDFDMPDITQNILQKMDNKIMELEEELQFIKTRAKDIREGLHNIGDNND